MKKKFYLIITLLLFVTTAFSQDISVIGNVTSSEDYSEIPGVTILIKGTTRGEVTDIYGNYSITLTDPNSVLIFRSVGFETQEITVGDRKVIDVVLKPSAEMLNEVVIAALGIKRQKRELGYSTQKVAGELVEKSSAPNVLSALTGRSAGVVVSNGDGVSGGSTRITIRGNNNIRGNNQPLIVVDGVQMENVPGLTDIGRGVDWGNAINNINAFDIESFNILKGGAASALYGSKGANGVIIITSKKGTKQNGIGVTYNMSYKIINPYRFREVQDKYGSGGPISLSNPELQWNSTHDTLLYPGIYSVNDLVINQAGDITSSTDEFGNYGGAVSWGPEMNGEMVKWWDGELRPYSPQPDNLRDPFHTGYTKTHNIAFSGGSEKGTLRVSITRMDHTPIIDNSDFNQTTVNVGANLNLTKKLKVEVATTYLKYNRLNSPLIGESYSSFSKGYLYSWGRSYKGLDRLNYELPDGSQNPLEGYPYKYVNKDLWWKFYNNNTNLDRDKYLGSLTFTYEIIPMLNLVGRIGRDFTLNQFKTKRKPIDVIGLKNGYYSNSLRRNTTDNSDIMLNFNKDNILKSGINVGFTAGAGRWDQKMYYIAGHSGTWYYPNSYMFSNITEPIYRTEGNITILEQAGNSAKGMMPTEAIMHRQTNSVYSFLNLSYNNYLFLDLTGRNDWSSTLPTGDNSYFYPSASMSFIASEVFKLQEKVDWFNFLKLRGGIAQTATDDDPYQTEFYYNTTLFAGQQSSGFPGVIPPIQLRPQRVNSYEGGANLGFFENRIDFDFTYYYMYSFDQIIRAPLPPSSGASNIKINTGTLSNKGFEIVLNTVPVMTKELLVKTGINISRNRNHVVSLGDHADIIELANIWGQNGPSISLREGDEFGTIVGYDYVYHANGQRILNDEGTEYLQTDTRVPIGNASPDFTGGWTLEVSYKNFRLSSLVDVKWGGDIYCGSYVIAQQTGQSPSTLLERDGGGLPYTDPDGNVNNVGVILDGVYADGTPNDKVVHYYYKYIKNMGGWGEVLSTPGIIENNWIKMREIALTYNLPQNVLSKIKIFQQLSVSIVGRDLFYIYSSLPDNINPEGIMGSGSAQGFEWASYPSSNSFTFSINATF